MYNLIIYLKKPHSTRHGFEMKSCFRNKTRNKTKHKKTDSHSVREVHLKHWIVKSKRRIESLNAVKRFSVLNRFCSNRGLRNSVCLHVQLSKAYAFKQPHKAPTAPAAECKPAHNEIHSITHFTPDLYSRALNGSSSSSMGIKTEFKEATTKRETKICININNGY